jgi:CO/xanthine dehydrogenase FAD-binding subunit
MARLIKKFEYLEPKTVEEAVKMLSDFGHKGVVLAGGTDLLIAMKRREINPHYVVNIKSIADLDYIQYHHEAGLRIGAVTTHSAIANSPVVRDKFDLLATASNKIGTPQVRNMGTIGGNICKAGPSQDTPPALLVLDARVRLVSLNGNRIVPMDEFFVGPFKTVFQETELLTEIQIPNPPPVSAGCYKWATKTVVVDETLVGVAVLMSLDHADGVCADLKIALGSVAPTPMRARRAEEVLRGKRIDDRLIEQTAQVAAEETEPRSRADYRRKMSKVLVREAIKEAWQKIQ